MNFSNRRTLFLLGFLVLIIISIPLTIFLIQRQQVFKGHAQATTTLSFSPDSSQTAIQKNTGDAVSLDVVVDPGQNLISFVKLIITYDSSKLAPTDNPFVVSSSAGLSILEGPVLTNGPIATIAATLSVGNDPTKVIQKPTTIATVNFTALAPTGGTTLVQFGSDSQVLSVGSSDQASENVLQSRAPATITIAQASASPTAILTPIPTSQIGGPVNQPPVCSSLSVDRAATGNAPFSITFTANGSDVDGTITKATFNFGDGNVSDVTTAGGIGTNLVNAQIAHTYVNAGTFQASAILTDNQGGISTQASCIQTVTVANAPIPTTSVGIGGINPTAIPTATQIVVPTATPATFVVQSTPAPTLAPTGPNDSVVGFAGVVGVLTIVGGILFFVL